MAAALLAVAAGGRAGQRAGPGDRGRSLQAMRKIQCSTEDGKVVTYGWHGYTYSRVPGEADRRLFRVEGMNIRACGPLADEPDGPGFRQVTREILLYQDPVTGEVLRKWKNPWTGNTVDVIQVTNDPVNQSYGLTGRDGRPFALPFSTQGNQWWLTSTVPLFYQNPLGGRVPGIRGWHVSRHRDVQLFR